MGSREEILFRLREKVSMHQRIGPDNPGLTRFFAARLYLVLIAGIYLAGVVFVFLYSMGYDPLNHTLSFSWPFSWPGTG
ncbi:MAG TPA: hypothetical protein VFE07_03660 [Marmoricola sp.]|jgi:hypothetical protein|nr:hypothetical protein [Marmoricola sp.]